MGFLRWVFNVPPSPRTCQYCRHYSAGHLDRQRNYYRCKKGHRLVLTDDELSKPGADEDLGTGEPMLGRTDCPDWIDAGCKFTVPWNPDYD